ncbi:acetylxylan esterase [Propioniciclava coleopterorum]|uniref:Acetylxylan esterase n=1 Tax=Propioniciclava coleopterorum TaxID=2714937 RepID=A0A6G7Y3R2_9ACTN|nr:acetylxylan esterase [Propioniciclava coleopterorum]QIK71288.1 acetylxylan esterase [Propioniciclava coleopterorum]
MAEFDLPLEQLRAYRPDVRRPDDLQAFWDATIEESRALAEPPRTERVETGMTLVDTHDVTFSGFGGHPIRAWAHVPAGASGPLPAVVEFHGYSGGRSLAWQNQVFATAGYVHLTVDSRGQGWKAVGATPDPTADAGLSTEPGVMTKGIADKDTYYYRRLFTDAALAVDAARALPWVDAARVAVTGASQGGGLAIAAGALNHDVVAVATDVPFLCHFERALAISDRDPYGEIVRHLARYRDRVEQTLDVLSYFDGANLAALAQAPALFSVGLRDQTCPPSTVYAAFNHWGGDDKEMAVYRFNDHEGGGEHHVPRKLAFLAQHLR